MAKKTEHIAEELILKYVEGEMSSNEVDKFERVLSQNEYIQKRVNTLQAIVDLNPVEVPPKDVHNAILSDLDLKDDMKKTFLEEMVDEFLKFFERRPIVLGTTLVALLIILTTITLNQSRSHYNYDDQSVADKAIDIESEKLEEDSSSELQY